MHVVCHSLLDNTQSTCLLFIGKQHADISLFLWLNSSEYSHSKKSNPCNHDSPKINFTGFPKNYLVIWKVSHGVNLQEFWKEKVTFSVKKKKRKEKNGIGMIMKTLENDINTVYILIIITGDSACSPIMQHNVCLYLVLDFN